MKKSCKIAIISCLFGVISAESYANVFPPIAVPKVCTFRAILISPPDGQTAARAFASGEILVEIELVPGTADLGATVTSNTASPAQPVFNTLWTYNFTVSFPGNQSDSAIHASLDTVSSEIRAPQYLAALPGAYFSRTVVTCPGGYTLTRTSNPPPPPPPVAPPLLNEVARALSVRPGGINEIIRTFPSAVAR